MSLSANRCPPRIKSGAGVAGTCASVLTHLRYDLPAASSVARGAWIMGRGVFSALVGATLALWALAPSALAQSPPAPNAKPEMKEGCPGLVADDGPRPIPAALRLAALASDQVRLTYVGHATFLIES